MVKPIVKDVEFLKISSTNLSQKEMYVVKDLEDTLKHHLDNCVGMADNMIGYSKNVITICLRNNEILSLINPKIISKMNSYETEEGCLSLDGVRPTTRYQKIIVKYYDVNFKKVTKTFVDFEAQIVQHEIDHLFGIII